MSETNGVFTDIFPSSLIRQGLKRRIIMTVGLSNNHNIFLASNYLIFKASKTIYLKVRLFHD